MLNKLKNMIRSPKIPTAEIQGIQHMTRHTPDVWKLTQSEFQRVFVYCDFMSGHKHNTMLTKYGHRMGTAYTSNLMTLWKKKLGKQSFPIAMEDNEPLKTDVLPVNKRIRGELYQINSSHIINLDNWKENGLQFLRIRTPIIVPYRTVVWRRQGGIETLEERKFIVNAWMYVGNPEYWDPLFDNGYQFTTVKTYKPKNESFGHYYHFSKLEYVENNT